MVIAETDREASQDHPSTVTLGAQLEEAVRRAQAGDESSFHAIVKELGPQVYRFLVVRLGHEGDAKDALQETLIAAWRGLPNLRRPDRVRSWFMTIAARKAAETARSRPAVVSEEGHEGATPDSVALVEIREALDALPADMRDALLARFLLGLSERESADMLGVPLGTVKSRVSRARQMFAQQLSEERMSNQEGEIDAP
jgi:RNA polymerase sigma-70 factor (ECF subfamily)